MFTDNPNHIGDVCGKAQCAVGETLGRPHDARAVLLAHAEGLREEAHRLETLARNLPPLPPEADRALFELAIHRRATTR